MAIVAVRLTAVVTGVEPAGIPVGSFASRAVTSARDCKPEDLERAVGV